MDDGSAHPTFEDVFRTPDVAQDNFRARLFGMFSEDIVRTWASNERAPYRYLGRPTLWTAPAYFTLDFLLERRADGLRFVAEQKAELAWEGYRYLRLVAADQLDHHRGTAFTWFLDMARDPTSHVVRVGAKPVEVHGAILVWGATTAEGCASAVAVHGLADVLSLEEMLVDLRAWRDPVWRDRVDLLRRWSAGLFDALV
ncbi:MAG: hypothetical protein KF809_09080 [Chloroflexi bacterium]|nr:hypothetical protein [Chloroflexota bacterium]